MPSSGASQFTNAITRPAIWLVVATVIVLTSARAVQGQVPANVHWPVVDGVARRQIVVSRTPSFSVGTADGAEYTLFAGVVGASRMQDGSVAIGDAGNNRIVFFDKNAKYIKSTGRVGAGPGEYKQPLWFGRCANGNFAIHDGNQLRVSFLGPDGAYRGALPLPARVPFDPIVWCSGQHNFFFLYNRARTYVRRGEIERVSTALMNIDERKTDTVWRGGIQEYYVGAEASGIFPLPFGEATLAAAGANRIYACVNLTARCSVFDSTGAKLREFSINLTAQRLGPQAWQQAKEEVVAAQSTRSLRELSLRVLSEVVPRNSAPLIDQARADLGGNLWIRTLDNYLTDWATWLVLTDRGTVVAAVAMPRQLRVFEIGADYVLGMTRDVDGVEHVEVHFFSPAVR